MTPLKLMAALIVGAAVSGCAALDTGTGGAAYTPASPGVFGFLDMGAEPEELVDLTSITVDRLTITVPRTLTVSEENSYYPAADIVWRGDPIGDRHDQIEAIFTEGFGRGLSNLRGTVPAALHVEVERFHSLTEKTRYTIGGIHSIRFIMTLTHAETGDLISGPKSVKANLKGYGGQRALEAERRGQTQKVRITDHLARVIQAELGRPVTEAEPETEAGIAEEPLARLETETAGF